MLLSLVSKRSLQVDSRDAYGFALRPQHLQRYQEYVSIYTEEESERAEKWKNFLDRLDGPAKTCSSEDEFQEADGPDSGEESVSEECSRKREHDSDCLPEREVQHLEQDSPVTVSEFTKEREIDEEKQVLNEHQYLREKSLGRHSEPVKDDEKESESEKEVSVESESEEDKQTQSVKEPVDNPVTVGELSKEGEPNEEVQFPKENQYLREKSIGKYSEPVKDYENQFESEKEKAISVETESDEEKQSQSEKEPVDSPVTVSELSKESETDEEAQVPKEHQYLREKSLGRHSEPAKDDEKQFESEKEEFSVKSEFGKEKQSDSDEEKQSQSLKAPVDHQHLQQDNATEKLVAEAGTCELEHEKEKKETKTRSVIGWAHIRPCLKSIEAMMCSRVKNSKYMKNKQSPLVGNHASSRKERLPSIGESEKNSGENDCDSETSADRCDLRKEENDAHSSDSPEPFFPWYEELEVLVRLGVPKDLRGEVWQAFVGVKARRVERYYEDLLAQITNSDESNEQPGSSDVQRKWKKQIEKDIPRTFPGHPALNENGRDSLRRILLAYACHNPSVGYCQAMNFFAGLLLLLMPEENAFWTLVGVIDDYFNGYYTEEMIESQVDQLVFEELMRERFPKLVNHLDYLGVQVAWISGPWFLSIFVNILPWECVLRMWDVLLFEGNRVVLFRIAFALMELYGPAIVATKDAGDAITSLQTLANSTFDSSQLVLTACMGYLSTNEARLEELRERHRPAVLEIVEERLQKGRIWKDKKGLASKLYSFKHEGSILDDQKSNQRNDGENPDESLNLDGINVDSELDSLPDLQEQVVWMKVELCRLLEEKRSAVLRAEELEVALMEMVTEDNRLELSARLEQLEKEVKELKQILSDKKEQEAAMLQVLMKVEQDQKLTEDARVSAEQDAAAQKYAVHMLQEKNEKLMAQLAIMEKRVVTAESTLEATLQYESGQNKALSSPRFARTQVSAQESPKKKIGFLSFGLGWRNKTKQVEESNSENTSNPTTPEAKSPSKESVSGQGSNLSKESKSEDISNLETKR